VKTVNFLVRRRGAQISVAERELLEQNLSERILLPARRTVIRKGELLGVSTLLVTGFMGRYMDDRAGHRQLVALHLPGDFVDLHAYPLQRLDHDVVTITDCEIATIAHDDLTRITESAPHLGRMLWFSTLLDAAMHREWIFRLGRLAALGRMAHFLCETHVRMEAIGMTQGLEFRLPLTQTDLGETCGLTNVHVSRILSGLRRQQLADVRDGVVRLLDWNRLVRLGEFDPDYLYFEDRLDTP
jgi:CRP-like cAMP-binding protein